ncbi:CheR family methyltransferase [Ectobacillus ponti]|uniref:protein-glutamate O-methyltransferase n=1 Tax=Ectobacillus ponti TaxID=2961894 RepID=A0AA41XA99_9BACI|nr:protein-glutamate O-methyltransferase CheR [Ectobacillus ponti]MCP8969210.1 protein-glutamate O-methyltransferase CheR [Ectobacillus ponti]
MIPITDKEFKDLADFIHRNYGIHLKEEKKTIVMGRLYQVLQQLNFDNFTDYLRYVLADPTEKAASVLVEKITTNHTFFMREAEHFQFLQHKVLPYLSQTIRDRDLRVWSAGCSSGEEPYTLAMILDEFFGLQKGSWDTKVLATDISHRVLEAAAKGTYATEALASLPPQWKHRYFKNNGDGTSDVVDKIKREVIFRRFNLMETSFPFKRKFHVIFCRNVMIYFDQKTKTELVRRFYQHMEPGGYLFIGQSETIDREAVPYRYIMPAVYRKEQ